MSEVKRVFKWWVGWNVEKIERWLEAQESDGWSLSKVSASGTGFTFTEGPARKVAFTVDYQMQAKGDYHQLLEDAGWSLVGVVAGWYFWRAPYSDVKPEFFTDTESLIDRNTRQMWLLALLLVVQIPSLNLTGRWAESHPGAFFVALQVLVLLTLGVCLVRYVVANRRLRERDRWQS